MIVGIPKERRPYEYRVGLPPAGLHLFTENDHVVYVERGAGVGAGFSDDDYAQAGAVIAYSEDEVLRRADLVLKFARPLQEELEVLREVRRWRGFSTSKRPGDKLRALPIRKSPPSPTRRSKTTTATAVLHPDEPAGGRSSQVAACLMQNDYGGRILRGMVGVPAPEVVIIGAGMVGGTAAGLFAVLGAHVTVLDVEMRRLHELQATCSKQLVTMFSTPHNIARACSYADVLIGAVYVPGERPPIVVTREMVSRMKRRSVIIDMAIDTGGCIETSRPTSHGSPAYVEEGVIHCCVPNLPGVLGRTGTYALFNAAYPYLKGIAQLGIERALKAMPALERGMESYRGEVRHLKRLVSLRSVEE
jgi:alanine dehydrogenase